MIISKTPLRISFVGGGTDFEDYYLSRKGSVVSTSINKHIYVAINRKFDNKIHLRYSELECVDDVDSLKHNIVREAMKMAGIDKGVEIVIISDIPTQGSGLGSSSCLSVGLLNAFFRYKGYTMSAKELAEKACVLEIERLGSPIGKQDQYATAYGGLNLIDFSSDRITVSNLYKYGVSSKLSWLKKSSMLFYLNGRSSNSILQRHKETILTNLDTLEEQRRLVPLFVNWISSGKGDFISPGKLISRSWECKKKITPDASSVKIEGILSDIQKVGGLGGKLCGAGGGGFLLVICDSVLQHKVRQVVTGLLELPFSFEQEGSRIVYADES